jgi:hypothetical protein
MSRGHGIIQREVLGVLRKQKRSAPPREATGLDTITLASLVYYGSHYRVFRKAEPKQQVAVRRALAALEREGLVIRVGERAPPKKRATWLARARYYWRAT